MESKKLQKENSSTLDGTIMDHQMAAFNDLIAIGRACFETDRSNLSIRPRTNTLIIGPSGSGKTHLAKKVALKLNASFFSISVSEWILLAGTTRGSCNTWPQIVKFLLGNAKAQGVVIFVDELDKIGGDTSWDRHLRNELFRLLDLEVPKGINLEDEDEENVCQGKLQEAENILRTKTLIIGAGAFQHLWHQSQKPNLGFCGDSGGKTPEKPDLAKLALSLPQELINRFCSRLVILPELHKADYLRMLEGAVGQIPENLRELFKRLGREKIHDAVRNRQGCRFLEEILLDALIEDQRFFEEFQQLLKEEEDNEKKGTFLE